MECWLPGVWCSEGASEPPHADPICVCCWLLSLSQPGFLERTTWTCGFLLECFQVPSDSRRLNSPPEVYWCEWLTPFSREIVDVGKTTCGMLFFRPPCVTAALGTQFPVPEQVGDCTQPWWQSKVHLKRALKSICCAVWGALVEDFAAYWIVQILAVQMWLVLHLRTQLWIWVKNYIPYLAK